MRAALLAAVLLLGACGGSTPELAPPPADRVDPVLQQDRRLARAAFDSGNYEQAAVLYERVIAAAVARDDLAMIADARYELAIVSLRRGDAQSAARLARLARGELTRHGRDPFPELFLVEAAAAIRLDEPARALSLLDDAAKRSADPAGPVALRVAYLRGVIAARADDAEALRDAIRALGPATDPAVAGDRGELEGRLALIENRDTDAVRYFAAAAEARRAAQDLEGLAEVLAFAGLAAMGTGDTRGAGDLYLRAGRSAQERGDVVSAKRWLNEALRIATEHDLPLVRREATDRLGTLARAG